MKQQKNKECNKCPIDCPIIIPMDIEGLVKEEIILPDIQESHNPKSQNRKIESLDFLHQFVHTNPNQNNSGNECHD